MNGGPYVLSNWFRNLWYSIIHWDTYDGTLPKKGGKREFIDAHISTDAYQGGLRTTSTIAVSKKPTRRRKK